MDETTQAQNSATPRIPAEETDDCSESSFWRAYQQLMYGLSLPERTLRSTTALVGGALHEAGQLLIPQAFRTSRCYETFVQQSLDFLLQHVGGIDRCSPERPAGAEQAANELLARKAVGSFLDMAGVATLHLSPMAVLAIVSDVAYGSQTYLKELSTELKRAGVVDPGSTIDSAADLLNAVQNASRVTSEVFDTPPLSAEGLRQTIAQTRQAVAEIDPTKVIPQAELEQMWTGIRELAQREGVTPFEVSSSIALYAVDKIGVVGKGALSSVTVAGNLFDRHIFDHYRQGLSEIRQQGLYSMLAENYRPYVAAVWTNFSSTNATVTQELFSGRLFGRAWDVVSGWMGRDGEGK